MPDSHPSNSSGSSHNSPQGGNGGSGSGSNNIGNSSTSNNNNLISLNLQVNAERIVNFYFVGNRLPGGIRD